MASELGKKPSSAYDVLTRYLDGLNLTTRLHGPDNLARHLNAVSEVPSLLGKTDELFRIFGDSGEKSRWAGLFDVASPLQREWEQSRKLFAEFHRPSGVEEMFRLTAHLRADGLLSSNFDRHHELLRAAVGPMDYLRQAGLFCPASPLQTQMEQVLRLSDEYVACYRLPESKEAPHLVGLLLANSVPSVLRYGSDPLVLQTAMEAMRSPWLHMQEQMRSISGFAEIQSIGHALDTMPAFGEPLTRALRTDLGDWRDAINWSKPIFGDFIARSDFYVERGFNSALTDFPAPAFRQSLDIAGLRQAPSGLISVDEDPIPVFDDPEEEGPLIRTSTAHSWLLRFEIRLRRFIDEHMSAAFGSEWARHRLPNGLYDDWQSKRHADATHSGSSRLLIDYADFTDYELIMCKRDNWREVFAPFFSRPESLRESLQRLCPIRVCTMHARPITQDDQLMLYVELRRIMRAIQ